MGNIKRKEKEVNTNHTSIANQNFTIKTSGEPVVTMATILKKIKNPKGTIENTVNPNTSVKDNPKDTTDNSVNDTQSDTTNENDNPDKIQNTEKDPFFDIPLNYDDNIYIRKEKYFQNKQKSTNTKKVLKMVMTTFIGVALGATLTLTYSHLVVYKCESRNLTQPDHTALPDPTQPPPIYTCHHS